MTTRTIAVVSGKGGSGKTMVAAGIARLLADAGAGTLVVDADLGTGGMSYYLGLKKVRAIRPGVSDVLMRDPRPFDFDDFLTSIVRSVEPGRDEDFGSAFWLAPVGDHRKLLGMDLPDTAAAESLAEIAARLRDSPYFEYVIFDCRGGIDVETLGVCSEADDILLVTEADTTSFQASRHLVDVLVDRRLAPRLHGFIVNKVFEDPTIFGRTGSSTFGARYLGAIPFDLDATRAFLVGELPASRSAFMQQMAWSLARLVPDARVEPNFPEWDGGRFGSLSLRDNAAARGGRVLLLATLLALSTFVVQDVVLRSVGRTTVLTQLAVLGLLSLLSATESAGRAVWRVLSVYGGLFVRARRRTR